MGRRVLPRHPLCCTDQQLGEVSPPHRHLFEASVFRPPKLQHTVERRGSNGHLCRLPPFGPRAQRVTIRTPRRSALPICPACHPPSSSLPNTTRSATRANLTPKS